MEKMVYFCLVCVYRIMAGGLRNRLLVIPVFQGEGHAIPCQMPPNKKEDILMPEIIISGFLVVLYQ